MARARRVGGGPPEIINIPDPTLMPSPMATLPATTPSDSPPPRQSRTLIDLGADMVALKSLILGSLGEGGEIQPETEAIFDQWFAEINVGLHQKVDGYAALIRERQLIASARREEMERLAMLVKADEGLAERLIERLRTFMIGEKIDKIETRRYKVSVQNASSAPLIVLVEVGELPEKYIRRHEPTADKMAIAADLKEGKEEATKVARFGERTKFLKIR